MIAVKEKEKRPRQGELLIICPRCACRCRAYSTGKSVTYYRCASPLGCDYTTKRARPSVQ